VRAAIDAEAAQRGWPALHAELAKVDPASAKRISRNDAQRIQRALEVWRLTGKAISSLQGSASNNLPFTLHAFAILPERDELKRRIEARFDDMLRAGLLDELRGLRSRYRLRPDLPSMRTVGYQQAWQHLEGEIDASEMRLLAITATRQLAKRQKTWLRSFREVRPVQPDAAALAAAVGQSFL
jgi:tRNA dimethylallyltransferase